MAALRLPVRSRARFKTHLPLSLGNLSMFSLCQQGLAAEARVSAIKTPLQIFAPLCLGNLSMFGRSQQVLAAETRIPTVKTPLQILMPLSLDDLSMFRLR
ncbi:hypothetical protein D7X12_15375 [Corallococcus sicarius]|uniref:Uncharacterized protein n=1 Tax=Corallococcus sicarius TaxID=2316726 RepID=A0A3A8NF04_9BACT|nr:hypothetical protein D7X12_15375 [Corallococcus sicarius]